MKRYTFILFFLLHNLLLTAQEPKLVDKIIAKVGSQIILLSDIELQYHQYKAQGQELPPNARCMLIDQMLLQKMLLTQAAVDSIEVSEDEVESELDRRIRYFVSLIGSKEKMEEYYKKSLLEIKEDFREDIEELLLSDRMRSTITRDVKVTPSDVKRFFNDIPKDSLPYYNAEVEIGQLVIKPKISKEQKAYAKAKIEKIRKEIVEDGADFELKAIINSKDDGSAQLGGEMDFFTRGDMVPSFEAAAFRLKEPGDISPVVESVFGFHIIQLIERRGENIKVRHILIKPEITDFELRKARNKLDSVRQLIIKDSLTFVQAVEKFSEDDNSKTNGGMLINQLTGTAYFEISQLDKGMAFIIDTMEVDEISAPYLFLTQRQEQAFRIIILKSESKPHVANLTDDYDRIKSAAMAAEEEKKMQEWIRNKAKKTYIQLDNDWHGCDGLEKWFSEKM